MSYVEDDRPQGVGRGISLSLVAALVIAVFAVGRYMMQRQVNPVTGQVQHIAMTVEQEKALGLQAAPEMERQMGGEIDPRRDARARLVQEVGNRLVERS